MAPLSPRFLRFLAVGVLNTFVGYAIYALGVLGGLPAQIALAAQFVLGALWNFGTHARLVFGTRGAERLPLYLGTYLLIWTLNALALHVLLNAGLSPLLAQLLILPGAVVLSYLLIARVLAPKRRAA